ncbi:KilA-N domain-containing protein [Chromobacterium violaceum]|uniref:KilA-N domain-containing protein n=1 Tax=Chromobacterium violaceum TaxID=536 RepID=UPI003DA9174B
MSNVIQIERIEIKLDAEDRYCLNDLHKASGGDQKNQPRYWLANQSAEELVAEISRIPLVTKMGRNGGTYVCRELVYAYAMWISSSFHLKVIRAFDRLNTKGVAVAEHAAADLRQNPLKYMR